MACKEIESLYQVFSSYGRPAKLEGCPCCTSSEEAEPLVRKPLRAISAPELEHYSFKALSTWGMLSDYKYFLPRILELTAETSLICDTEIIFHKLSYGGFKDWPANEQQAVSDFIFALWRESVGKFDIDRADSCLCGAAAVLPEISSLLEYADATHPGFKSAYGAQHSNQLKRKLLNSFWDRDSPNYQCVVSWLYPRQQIRFGQDN